MYSSFVVLFDIFILEFQKEVVNNSQFIQKIKKVGKKSSLPAVTIFFLGDGYKSTNQYTFPTSPIHHRIAGHIYHPLCHRIRAQKLQGAQIEAKMETATEMKSAVDKQGTSVGSSDPVPLLSNKQWLSIVEFFTQLKVRRHHFISSFIHSSENDYSLVSLLTDTSPPWLLLPLLLCISCMWHRLCVGRIIFSS